MAMIDFKLAHVAGGGADGPFQIEPGQTIQMTVPQKRRGFYFRANVAKVAAPIGTLTLTLTLAPPPGTNADVVRKIRVTPNAAGFDLQERFLGLEIVGTYTLTVELSALPPAAPAEQRAAAAPPPEPAVAPAPPASVDAHPATVAPPEPQAPAA